MRYNSDIPGRIPCEDNVLYNPYLNAKMQLKKEYQIEQFLKGIHLWS